VQATGGDYQVSRDVLLLDNMPLACYDFLSSSRNLICFILSDRQRFLPRNRLLRIIKYYNKIQGTVTYDSSFELDVLKLLSSNIISNHVVVT
jgi:hypothetical protein